MFFSQTSQDIANRISTSLKTNTAITDLDPGTIARSLVDVISEEFGDMYRELELTTTMGFVSTAQGTFLEMIGALLNCTRLVGELDTNYRSRIINQVYTIAGANQSSIRLKALSVPGVRNVIMREHTKGTGSFSIYVITDDVITPQSLLDQVESVIADTKAAGILADVKTPVLIPIEVKVRLMFSDKASDAEKASIRQIAKQNTKMYIDNIGLGGTFTVNEIIRTAMSVNSKVIDVDVYSLMVNGMAQFLRNFSIGWDERIVISKLEVM